ncbi:MAG: hypothetical protein AB8B78_01085 [Polaribacter sp.]
MKRFLAKISLIIVIASMFSACNAIKKVNEDELLLTKNTVYVNDKKLYDEDAESQIYQKPNSRFLNYPLRLNIYNLAEENPDSTFQAWLNRKPKRKERLMKRYSEKQVVELGNYKVGFNNWLMKTGEAPVII